MWKTAFYACALLLAPIGYSVAQAQNAAQVVIDAYPITTMVEQGSTLILVCRVVGVPSTTVLSYQWTCPGGYCDAGAVDPEWAARIQQGNILVVNVRNGSDNGTYTCNIVGGDSTQQMGTASYTLTVTHGLFLFNEDGGLRVFFPRNSFVTNTLLTHTNNPRGGDKGNDHIVCYGSSQTTITVTWYNSNGVMLEDCGEPCRDCGPKCVRNGGVGVDKPHLRRTDIHMYTDSPAYVNQDLECQMFGIGGRSAFIGVYLKDGVSTTLQPPSSITRGATTTTSVSVSWYQVLNATGYYVSYQRQDLGAPPVVTPQYERIVGGTTTSVTLSGLEPGTAYRIRVWSRDGTSVSRGATIKDVTTMESAPSPPRMLTMIGEPTGSTVELNWLPPLHPNGAIHYEIEYEPAIAPGDPVNAGSSSSPYFTLTLPNEFLTYNVTVIAVNTNSSRQSSPLSVRPGQKRQEGPQPPMGISVVANGCNSANMSWTASVSRMCDAVIGNYSVRYQLMSGEGGYVTVSSSSTSVTLQGLDPNAEYTVSVAGINSCGGMSTFTTTQFKFQDPAPPNGVTPAVTGCDSAVVTWGASISMFETVGNYSVRYHMRNGTSGSATVYTSSTSATLQGLAPNAEYNVSVAGINSCGGTSTFAMATFALQDPAPPTGVSVVSGTECGTAAVSWSPSQVNYNAAIGNYSVRYRLRDSTGGYTTVYSSSTSVTLRGLDPRMEYTVEVAAVNSCGRLSGFSMVAQLDLQGSSMAPRPPTGVSVEDGAGCYTSVASWVASQPVCDVVVGNYSVRFRMRSSGGYTTVYSPSTSVTLQGLVPNAEYTVSVATINSAGEMSAYTETTQFELQEPTPPTGMTFTVTGSDTAVVSWTASQSMCDDVVGNYSVRYRLRSGTCAYTTVYTTKTSVTLRDLIPNAEYVVSVAAINSRGDMSAFSVETPFTVSTPATPTTPGPQTGAPEPPTVVSVEDGAGCYTSVVSWTPQPVCGVVVGNYSVRFRLRSSGGYTTMYSPSTSVTLQGLVPNAEYTVSVAAINSMGEMSAFTETVQFELQEPKPPTGVTFTATGSDSAVVSWMASQSMCDDVVGNYSVKYRLREGTGDIMTVYTSKTSVTLQDLIPNAEYVVLVAAINSRGDMSALSVETPFTVSTPATPKSTPTTAPPMPSSPGPQTGGNGCVAVSAAVGAAVGGLIAGFIGGVLLTAVIAGVVFYRAKRNFTAKFDMNDPLYEDPHPELQLQSNPAYEMVNVTTPMK